MSRSIPLFAVLAAAAALGACSKGQVQREPTSEVFKETSVVREGTVADLQENRILFWDSDNPDQPLALELSDDTTYVKEGDFVDKGNLEEGSAVRVFFDETQENPEALRVEILSGDEAESIEERVKKATGRN